MQHHRSNDNQAYIRHAIVIDRDDNGNDEHDGDDGDHGEDGFNAR